MDDQYPQPPEFLLVRHQMLEVHCQSLLRLVPEQVLLQVALPEH
jgi:hypothetical protein